MSGFLNVGLIGLGRMGSVYARNLAQRVPQARLVAAAAEPDLEGADQLADRLARSLLQRGIEPHLARDVVKDVTGLPRNRVYECVQSAQRDNSAAGDLAR